MDKETLSNYGWIVICVLVLAVMIALAGPFGTFVAGAVKSTTAGLFGVNQNALGAAGITINDQAFADGGNGGAGDQGGTGLPAVGTSAEDCTWEQIKAISEAGKSDEYFNLGDTKTITTTDGITVVMEIIAFDTDIKADGTGTAGITWLSKGIIDTRAFNQSNSITNGWKSSELRTWLQGDFYGKLSSDVISAIVSVNKGYYNHTTKLTEICVDNVWIPSVGEMCGYGVDSFGCEDSGVEYTTYFNDRTIRTKYDANGDSVMWWLRSAGNTNGYGRAVNSTGGFTAGSKPNEILGVTLGFCT